MFRKLDMNIGPPYSSFSQFVADGLYQKDWGAMDVIVVDGDFGE